MLMPRRTQLFAAYGRTLIVALAIAIAMLVAPRSYADSAAPETSAVGVHGMVVSESDDAAHAGVEILKHGGNAVDAALATELAVGVTNPAACGIGGGGFMLIYMAKAHRFYALDYRETRAATGAPRHVYAQRQARRGPRARRHPRRGRAGRDRRYRRCAQALRHHEVSANRGAGRETRRRWLRRQPAPRQRNRDARAETENRSRARPGLPQARRLRAQGRRHDRRKESRRDAERPRRQSGRKFLSRRSRIGAGRVHEGAWRI